jgi:hypothetical protein
MLSRTGLVVNIVLVFVMAACDQPDRIATLEKQVKELQGEVTKQKASADFDFQERCARDARVWFKENWSSDKNTIVLDYINHYDKNLNHCFIQVEYHYSFGTGMSWVKDTSIWDVNENTKFGDFSETHYIYGKPDMKDEDTVGECNVMETKCKTLDEYRRLVSSYLND